MQTPFVGTLKYFFLCFFSLELMHLLMRSSLNFTYIPAITLVLTILFRLDHRKPEKNLMNLGMGTSAEPDSTFTPIETPKKV